MSKSGVRTKPTPSQDYLKRMVDYDPETGVFVWKARAAEDFTQSGRLNPDSLAKWYNGRFAGKNAFCAPHVSGYRCGMFENQSYLAHRIAWKIVKGEDAEYIDHINGDKADNRISNLRSVSFSENLKNKPRHSNNQSGQSGVSWHSRDKVWMVQISRKYIGSFRTFDEAVAARKAAEISLGYHANHGRKV